jgi:hypothetical protein
MNTMRHGMRLAVLEHLNLGKPITRLEAMVLYGVQSVNTEISRLRKEGWVIDSQPVPYATAVRRVNEFAVFKPPKNLPVNEIQLTEYWISK